MKPETRRYTGSLPSLPISEERLCGFPRKVNRVHLGLFHSLRRGCKCLPRTVDPATYPPRGLGGFISHLEPQETNMKVSLFAAMILAVGSAAANAENATADIIGMDGSRIGSATLT